MALALSQQSGPFVPQAVQPTACLWLIPDPSQFAVLLLLLAGAVLLHVLQGSAGSTLFRMALRALGLKCRLVLCISIPPAEK